MYFETESIRESGLTGLVEEHQLLVEWVKKHPTLGIMAYLDHRMVNRDSRVALYYIHGIGMSDGERFALVNQQNIYVFDVDQERDRITHREAISRQVTWIWFPEDAKLNREEFRRVAVAALTSYYAERDTFFVDFPRNLSFSFENARWVVVPRKHSLLYWRQKIKVWLDKQKPRATGLRRILASPIVALLVLVASFFLPKQLEWISVWPIVLSGAWFVSRLTQYDDNYVAWSWFFGVLRPKHAWWPTLDAMSRVFDPQPLPALTVWVEFLDADRSACVLKVKNTSYVPVRHLSFGAGALANLLAPGLMDSLREKNGGAINSKELENIFPRLERNWILPRQTVEWRVPLLKEYPSGKLKTQVEAIVNVPRVVSGMRRKGPAVYSLPVTSPSGT